MQPPGESQPNEVSIELTPYLTADLSGIGGTLKSHPDDFVVEEIPIYEPCGDGEHIFLWVEKRDTSAEQLLRHLSRALGISTQDIGTAAMKDRQAVTRQFVSVPARCSDRIGAIASERIRVLDHSRHTNKLRTGHLHGNRFSILVRGVAAEALAPARAVAERIAAFGFPNYFGEQRFGSDGTTAQTGLDLLCGRTGSADLPASRRKFLLKLSLSAVQSLLFNRVLAQRVSDGLAHRVLPGDVMQVNASGGCFVVEDVATEQLRCDRRETAITGPMFGPKMKSPAGEAAQQEQQVLDDSGLSPDHFTRFKKLTSGTRRPLLVWPEALVVEADPDGLRFQFSLPSGAYATTLLREFMKSATFGSDRE